LADHQVTPGRWGGRLTSRPLPEVDASVEALCPSHREELARHWLERAAAERRVGEAFVVVHQALVEDDAAPEIAALAARAVDDERRHCELSIHVASRFAGRPLDAPARLELSVPSHPGAQRSVERTLHVFGHCALNETFASAVLEASLAATTGPLASAAIRELLSDELDHARIGWAHLASISEARKRALGPWVLSLVQANLRTWRTTPREYPSDEALVSQGALSRKLLETALRNALETLVIPGLQHVGLPTAEVVEWWGEESRP
jgi:hypothetical protein